VVVGRISLKGAVQMWRGSTRPWRRLGVRSSDSFGTARVDLLFEWSVARRVESKTGG